MAIQRTLSIIKPDAVAKNVIGEIISRFEKNDLKIIAAKLITLSDSEAGGFYAEHEGKPFYNDLIAFMTSGPCMVLALKKDNAVASWRKTIGATNPQDAEENTIRRDFATSVQENAVHGSDSDENAEKEIAFFFTDSELLSN